MEVAQVLAIFGGTLVVFTFIGVTWKLMRFIFKVDKALPTLINIAAQFESNGGTTLKDKIEKLAEDNILAVSTAKDSKLIAETNASIVNELTGTHTKDLHELRDYLHSGIHGLRTAMATITLQSAITDQRSERIEERLDKLLPLVIRRTDDSPEDEGHSGASAT